MVFFIPCHVSRDKVAGYVTAAVYIAEGALLNAQGATYMVFPLVEPQSYQSCTQSALPGQDPHSLFSFFRLSFRFSNKIAPILQPRLFGIAFVTGDARTKSDPSTIHPRYFKIHGLIFSRAIFCIKSCKPMY